ncbi:UNVERIFIED_CONTAM: putative copper-transporting ATPase HMA5 [Sesamum angustifolium]|uniref:Copper-transporting ATPase HMA5 n=1 Tax=Sesamum angustifolium TaxID=2727405 RepID=A0AAW2MK42_9LAMI
MAAKFLSLACIRPNDSGNLSPRPHYPSMPKYPKGVSVSSDEEKFVQGSESKALFSVTGMTCSACAGSVEKAVKRLPGIKEAVVDVLNNRAQVTFYPAFVNVSYYVYVVLICVFGVLHAAFVCLSIGVSADLIKGELEK